MIILAVLVVIALILAVWVFVSMVKTQAATAINPRKRKAAEEPSPPAEKAAAGKKPESSDRDFTPSQF
ncbi:MAG: hypothetical protein V3V55_05985 [Rhodospirillales bacterium]